MSADFSLKNSPKPAFVSGFLWVTFSGTAMLSAFVLPVHIWALQAGYAPKLENFFFLGYFFIVFACALYHGLYRTKTVLFDLGLIRERKSTNSVQSPGSS